MTRLTIELQDDIYLRLHELAQARGVSLDLFIETLGTAAITAQGSKDRFRALALQANAARAREILDRLDREEQPAP